jgi:hypothetical protein
MFGRKKQPPVQGRQRPPLSPDRQSAAVFSYHAARSSRQVSRNAARSTDKAQQADSRGAAAERRDAHSGGLKRSATTIGVVLLAALLLSSLFLGTNPKVVFDGGTASQVFLHTPEAYQQAAAQLLRSSVSNRTKTTLNGSRLAAELQKQFPELESVRVSLPVLGYQPVVHLTAAQPALVMSTASGGSYVLATDGRALVTPAQVPDIASLHLPVVTDQSGLPIHAGAVALPGSTVTYITEVVGQLQAAHLTVASLTLPKAMSELDVHLNGVPYFVKFNLMGQAREEAGAFLATKAQLERKSIHPAAYVDVRVDGRAYFK